MKTVMLKLEVRVPKDTKDSEVIRLVNRVIDAGYGLAMDTDKDEDPDIEVLEKFEINSPKILT